MLFIDQQQKQPEPFLHISVFTQADLATGEQQQRSKPAETRATTAILPALPTNDKKRLSEVVLANAFSMFQHRVLSSTL